MSESIKKYLVSSDNDQKWGITVNTVGMAKVPIDYSQYPPSGHPVDFNFDIHQGRILDSYQLIYISCGKGIYYDTPNHKIDLNAGDLFIIRPNIWHSYFPDKKTGWQEYWIGLKGTNIDSRFENNFFDKNQIIYKVGYKDEIVDLFLRALSIAEREQTAHQQFLAGIANLILGMAMYYDKNERFADNRTAIQINRAKTIMRENLLNNISLEEIASQVNMSYSWFRKTFKEYTNLSPAHYIQELKLQKAKNMLVTTSITVKEIAIALNYDNVSHFTTMFKKHSGQPPLEYRANYEPHRKE